MFWRKEVGLFLRPWGYLVFRNTFPEVLLGAIYSWWLKRSGRVFSVYHYVPRLRVLSFNSYSVSINTLGGVTFLPGVSWNLG